MGILIKTTRFGDVTVELEAVVTFVQPIIGFEQQRRFVILPGPQDGHVKWLQAVDAPALAFLIMDPRVVLPEYRADLTAADLAELAVTTLDTLDIYTLVVVPKDRSKVRTNLKAPILVNPLKKLAKQVILENTAYPVQFFLAAAERASQAPGEVI